MLPLTQLTAPAVPADVAALAPALAAGVGVALPLQAATTNTAASAKAPMRLDVAMMDTDLIPPCLSAITASSGAGGESLWFSFCPQTLAAPSTGHLRIV